MAEIKKPFYIDPKRKFKPGMITMDPTAENPVNCQYGDLNVVQVYDYIFALSDMLSDIMMEQYQKETADFKGDDKKLDKWLAEKRKLKL